MRVFINKMLKNSRRNACRSSKKATILNLSKNERSSVIGSLQSCDQQPVFVEGAKSPRAFVASQSPLKIFGLRQPKRHCRVRIIIIDYILLNSFNQTRIMKKKNRW